MVYLWKATVRDVILKMRPISFIACPSASSCSTSRLPRAQLAGSCCRLGLPQEVIDQSLSGQRRDIGRPLKDLLNRLQQLRCGRVFQKVAGGSGSKGLRRDIGILAHRQEQHFDLWHRALELPRRVESVELRHGDVENDNVGPEFGGHCQQSATIGHGPHDVTSWLEQLRKRLANQTVVIRQ